MLNITKLWSSEIIRKLLTSLSLSLSLYKNHIIYLSNGASLSLYIIQRERETKSIFLSLLSVIQRERRIFRDCNYFKGIKGGLIAESGIC
jgi:hypothetical protein